MSKLTEALDVIEGVGKTGNEAGSAEVPGYKPICLGDKDYETWQHLRALSYDQITKEGFVKLKRLNNKVFRSFGL